MKFFHLIWPHLKAALEATYVSIEIAIVGAFIAWLQLRYAKKRDKELDIRNSWEKIHKVMMEFRFRRECLNSPPPGQHAGMWIAETLEALHNIRGQLERTPDSPLVIEIKTFLANNWKAEQWRAAAFTEQFDKFVHEAASKSR
jgi:hypothetical protein